jgi:S-adenosylmethionine:tRNA ribosyltransferase-isomerase
MQNFRLSDFHYELPQDRIAKFPLEKRDLSRLLEYKHGNIQHHTFRALPSLLPCNSLMVFNNTKVIPARLYFKRRTGALIEIFLLSPVLPSPLIQLTMEAQVEVVWESMIGNLKKWKEGEVLNNEFTHNGQKLILHASLVNREKKWVKLSWNPQHLTFASIVEMAGEVPLPPYLNRRAVAEDKPRYQTVYSANEGAVAAPTAGLHFTDDVLNELSSKRVRSEYLTLHVSAGTFQPIKSENPTEHPMHCEQMIFSKSNLENLLNCGDKRIAVGTTSMRSMESLYWFGVKLLIDKNNTFEIHQEYPYRFSPGDLPSTQESIGAILKWMEIEEKNILTGSTSIYIYPGYDFKMVDGLITNFHQPGSTLMLLVAAFVGKDWKKIYQEALEQQYRFLSYGDSSLLWR